MDISGILELQSAIGSNKKKAIIEKHKDDLDFKSILYYALNPLLTYNFSEASLSSCRDCHAQGSFTFGSFFECCDFLSKLNGVDDATAEYVRDYISSFDKPEREICIGVLSKTLKLGITAKTVNKIIPNLIPEWDVQQAYTIDKYPVEDGTEFWLTQKLNGVRATFCNNKLISRSGVPFTGLEHIISEISWLSLSGFVVDGELTLLHKDGISDNEAFRIATGIINSEDANKTEICYTIFDIIPSSEFENNIEETDYKTRREILSALDVYLKHHNAVYTSVLPVLYHGNNTGVITKLLDKMVSEDKEGLMLNLNTPYKRKRHSGILKIKRFYTMDLPIIGYEEGSGKYKGTLGSLVLSYKDNEVRVGSGLTDEQRSEFWKNKDSLIGILCEVKYKDISFDKSTGLESLQFPVFIRLRDDKGEVSYG